jgi:hypothetical protein
MAMSDLFNNLLQNYRRMVDDELIELARGADELTPEAQMALRSELGRRGITDEHWKEPEPRRNVQAASRQPTGSGAIVGDMVHDTVNDIEGEPSAPELVAVFSSEDEQGAQRAQALLQNAGIESRQQIVLLVSPSDAEKAFEIFSEQLEDEEESGS